MKVIRYALLVFLVTLNSAGTPRGLLALKVTALDQDVKSGAKITIEVATTNESNRETTYHNTSIVCDYELKVITNSGSLSGETPFKKQHHCVSGDELKITGRNILVTLKPGESASEQIAVTEQYDMTAAGEYSIQVERTFPGIGHFRSNTLTVKVMQ